MFIERQRWGNRDLERVDMETENCWNWANKSKLINQNFFLLFFPSSRNISSHFNHIVITVLINWLIFGTIDFCDLSCCWKTYWYSNTLTFFPFLSMKWTLSHTHITLCVQCKISFTLSLCFKRNVQLIAKVHIPKGKKSRTVECPRKDQMKKRSRK